jgi:DAPG hydrolase-like protein
VPALVTLPEARPVLWPLRPVESARRSVVPRDGRVVVTVEHAVLRGVTTEMLTWWYGHIAGTMSYAGREYPRFQVWHPLDHISYTVLGPEAHGVVTRGARLRVVEALGRDPRQLVDIRVDVEELCDGRAVTAKRIAGNGIVRLENEFMPATGGSSQVSRLTIGDTTPAGRLLFNRVAQRRAFPPERIVPWIRHHVEEIGNLEHFLPDLFHS